MGFLVVKTETQLAVLGTARKAIYIVQYWCFTKLFLVIGKRIINALCKGDKPVSNHDSPIRNRIPKPLTKALHRRLSRPR